MKRIVFSAILSLLCTGMTIAQTPQEQYDAFRKQAWQQYEDFRSHANQQYADFVKQVWQQYHSMAAELEPFEKPVPPVVVPEEDRGKKRNNEKKPFEEVVVVEPPKPQPQPVEPVKPVKPVDPPKPVKPVKPRRETVATRFFGTEMQYTVATRPQFSLYGLSEEAISDTWRQISDGRCDELLVQCLEMRSHFQLCDWGYIQMLDSLSHTAIHSSASHSSTTSSPNLTEQQKNEATLLMAWLYCQSGYKMRLARADGHLYMLFASESIIYNHNWFTIDDDRFYPYKGENIEELYICDASFPKEQSMTLRMSAEPLLAVCSSSQRTLQSEQYRNVKVESTVNKNLIDFYNDYPTGYSGGDFGTRWAIYANTPLSDKARQNLYPQLQKQLQGKNQLQATEELLNFVQTAFVYEYDSIVWGQDRAFFAEETLFYPYADCEDRSILFSRLVRDLLGLEVVLLYYPGHLATAVRFEGEQPTGDYFQLPDGHYFVADPTYIGAPVGLSMPSVREEKIKLIVLQ